MEEVTICRICLVTDVKMYDVQLEPYNLYFKSVTGSNMSKIANYPPYVCYECAALLTKFHLFKQKCFKGQDLLNAFIDHKVNPLKLKQIDRQSLGLCSNLSTYSIPESSIHNILKTETIFKEESVFETTEPNFVATEMFSYIEVVSIEGIGADLMKADDVKKEEIDVLSPKYQTSVDDDIPLQIDDVVKNDDSRKNKAVVELVKKKQKNAKKVPVSRKKEKNTKSNKLIHKLVDDVIVTKLSNAKKVPVPRKKEKNTTSNKLIHTLVDDVIVTKLSLEEQIEELNKRKESSNYLFSPFKCNLCYKGFLDTAAWELHLQKHSPSAGDMECPVCKFRFKTKRNLRKHCTHHDTKYACKYCPYISSIPYQAKIHLGQHKGVKYTCKHCDLSFAVRTTYFSHLRIKHPSEIICDICGCSYVSKYGLNQHKVLMHKDVMGKSEDMTEDSAAETKGIYCEECDISFLSMEAYKRHTAKSIKHIKNRNQCPICGELFANYDEMKLHRRTKHRRKQTLVTHKRPPKLNFQWPINCEHCSEEIANGREHWSHYRRVHPDKKYPVPKDFMCDICGKSFQINAQLVYHRRTHTGERPHACARCHKRFCVLTTLHAHLRTHSELRPFVCDLCHKAFKFRSAIKKHLATHSGERPYQCDICSKSFTTARGRKVHINTVHFRQPETFVTRKRKKKDKDDKEPAN